MNTTSYKGTTDLGYHCAYCKEDFPTPKSYKKHTKTCQKRHFPKLSQSEKNLFDYWRKLGYL